MVAAGAADTARFDRAVASIDAANVDDPNRIRVRGEERPKELAHAELVTEWVRRLRPDASEELLLAARAHHVRRWEIPRDSYPDGRSGYLRWRRALHDLHAEVAGHALSEAGYEPAVIERVQAIVRKRNLARDAEVQALEDALCLVFLETQFDALADRLDAQKMDDVVRKTLVKMSDEGKRLASTLDVGDDERAALERALRTPGG
ncbi:MAG TPA: DUF4202 domain-containing protein [Acidimicrobiia bacterium]|nr:DUF4202 domain-containing protein [Acidimicrobiia bacterium]